MFKNPEADLKKLGVKNINCLLTDGGLGDMLAALVAVNYIVKTYKHVNLLVWVPDYLLEFAKNVLPTVSVRDFTTAKEKYNPELPSITTRWNGRHSGMKVHPVDYAFHMLCDQDVALKHKNYLKPDFTKVNRALPVEMFRTYVVVTTGFTAANREFLPDTINAITKYIKEAGYDVVFLGKKQTTTGTKHIIQGNFNEEIDFSVGTNLIDKTSLLEAALVMNDSMAVVGLDNGLLHLAGCTSVNIVGGFTNVDPKFRMPYRQDKLGRWYHPVVPPESLGCRFCQSNMNFVYNHDFKECFNGPQDYSCIKQLTADLYIKELEKIL